MRLPRFLVRRIARWAIPRARQNPYYPIYNRDGSVYMDRGWVKWFGTDGFDENGEEQPHMALRVHWIRTSDDGKEKHDHPWSFFTLLLHNGYFEVRDGKDGSDVITWYPEGSILFRRATTWHRLRLPRAPDGVGEQCVVTLFFQFPKVQSWGFLDNGVKVYWKTFLARRLAQAAQQAKEAVDA